MNHSLIGYFAHVSNFCIRFSGKKMTLNFAKDLHFNKMDNYQRYYEPQAIDYGL